MSHNPVAQALSESPLLILDGALATELEARGCQLADALWSAKVLMENPELIYQVHYYRQLSGDAAGLCHTRAGSGTVAGVDCAERRTGATRARRLSGDTI